MKKLVIIGAGLFGREVCNYARQAGYTIKGFLDSRSDVLNGYSGYPKILSSVESYSPGSEDVFVCAIGESGYREQFVKMIADKGGIFVNVIHPSAYVGPNVKIGTGCILCPFAMVDCDLSLGNHVVVNAQAYVPHDCVLEDFSTVSPGCRLGGGVIVRHGTFLGLGATILPGVVIGEYAYVAAGAVVTRSVPASVMVAGTPAEIKKHL